MALFRSDAHWSNDSLVLCTSSSAATLLNLPEPIITASLDRISLIESIPRFPSGHRPPFFTLIELREQAHDATHQEAIGLHRNEQIVVTAPTAPRMKAILEEKIVINTWTVHPESPPCHTPWCGFGSTSESTVLSRNTGDILPLVPKSSVEQSPDTTLSTIRERSRGARGRAIVGAKHEGNLPRYLRLQHTSKPTSGKPANLAVRRGHKAFPALKLDQITRPRKNETTPYDSIPTAFRGSLTVHSPAFYQTLVPEPQDLSLTEMLENLREKCAFFSSRVSLPTDWFYRPGLSKDAAKLSYTAPFGRRPEGDEPVVAGPRVEATNSSQPTKFGSSDVRSVFRKNGKLDVNLSPVLCKNIGLEDQGTSDFQIGDPFLSPPPVTPKRPSPLRPSFVNPASPRQSRPKVRKTVRFADLPSSHKRASTENPDRCADPVSPTAHLSSRQTRRTVTSSALAPRDRLSFVPAVQPAIPVAENSWARGHTLVSPPPPQRPFSYRFPTYPKLLPGSMNGSEITQPWSSSTLQRSLKDQQPPPEAAGKSPPAISVSITKRPSGKRSFKKNGKAYSTKGPLKISNPIPITSAPRLRRNEDDVQKENGKEVSSSRTRVTTPLRTIFTRFK